jgi:TRAP-type C4-dicarboxylate transport system permease small subunit
MDVIVAMMPAKLRDALQLFSELAFLLTALMIVSFSFPVIRDLYNFDQRSQSAEVPLYIPQSLIPIGLLIMAFLVVVRLVTGGDRDASGTPGH